MDKELYERIMLNGGFKQLDKTVYKFSNGAEKFINGISTNEVKTGKNAFTDPFGKLIVLFDQFIDGDDIYIVFNRKFEQRVLDHLKIYIKFSKTKIEKQDLNTYHVIGKTEEKITIPQKIGNLVLAKTNPDLTEIPEDIYTVIRLENNMTEQGIDFDQEMLLNVDWHDAVSFTKGCFIGQEILARVHNLGKPPKKLVRIGSDKPVENATTQAFCPKYQKYLAFKIVSSNDHDQRIL